MLNFSYFPSHFLSFIEASSRFVNFSHIQITDLHLFLKGYVKTILKEIHFISVSHKINLLLFIQFINKLWEKWETMSLWFIGPRWIWWVYISVGHWYQGIVHIIVLKINSLSLSLFNHLTVSEKFSGELEVFLVDLHIKLKEGSELKFSMQNFVPWKTCF